MVLSERRLRRYGLSAMGKEPKRATDKPIRRRIERLRRDDLFKARLAKLIEQNRRVLDRLSR